jgi:hypothetical protein
MAIEEPPTSSGVKVLAVRAAIGQAAARAQVIAPAVELEPEIGQVAARAQAIAQAAVRAQAIAQAAVRAQAIGQVAELEPEIGQVAARAQVTGPEEAEELRIAQEVEVETDRPRVHLAVPAKTKSVTVAHHRGLVRLPARAEDSAAAVAETMPEPAAIEVVAAWVVAG